MNESAQGDRAGREARVWDWCVADHKGADMEQIERAGLAGPVEENLLHGAENARLSREIMKRLEITDERDFRQMVERERDARVILANHKGLFLPAFGPDGDREIERFIRTGEARIRGPARALKTARAELRRRKAANQLSLDLEGGEVNGPT